MNPHMAMASLIVAALRAVDSNTGEPMEPTP